MDEKIRREEMSDIDAMNAMEEIDRISTGEGADELNGIWSSAGPRGISDGVMDNMEQIPPDEFEQGQPAEPMHERRGGGTEQGEKQPVPQQRKRSDIPKRGVQRCERRADKPYPR